MRINRLGIIVLAAALAGGGAAADEPNNHKLPRELGWIPPDGVAFLHVRFADLWNHPAGQAARAALLREDPHAIERIERAIGVRLEQVDRLTLVIPSTGGVLPEESILVRVTTRTPYDRTAVLEQLGVKRAPLPRVAQLPDSGGLVRFSDPTNLSFAYSRSRAVNLLAALERPGKPGRLEAAIRLAGENHLFVAGVDVGQARQLPWLADDTSLRPLFIARTAVLIGDLKPGGLDVRLRLATGLRSHAEEVRETLEARRTDALEALAGMIRSAGTAEANRVKIVQGVIAALKAARIEQSDRDVTVAGTLNSVEPLAVLALDGVDAVQCAADRLISVNNLKQIGLAMHNYHDANGFLPQAATCDKSGKPLLSWRVAILPYLEQDNLYREFKLDEPWDSEHNKKLIAKMPRIYALPGDRRKYDLPSSYYRVFAGGGAMFDYKQKINFAGITDGLSNTLMVVEAADAVPWTKPDEIVYDPKKPPRMGYHYAGRGNALYGDGSVGTIRRTINENTLHLLIQRNDGNPVERPN